MAYLLNYTRAPVNEVLYDPKLAFSMHLALSEDGSQYRALNHNSGVLFAKATENADGSLNPKSMKNPWLFRLPNGGFGVAAIRTGGDGEDDEESRGCVLCFRSDDLLCYEELGLLKLGTDYVEKVQCSCNADTGDIAVIWQERDGGCCVSSVPGNAWRPSADGGLVLGRVPEVRENFESSVLTGACGNFANGNHAETVCLLSKLNVKQHIEVELTMDEMDLTAAEKKASYEEIKEYVLEKFGMKVSHLYIAQVKRKCGIIERENYNKPKSEDSRQPQCPPEKEAAIRTALEHFGMI